MFKYKRIAVLKFKLEIQRLKQLKVNNLQLNGNCENSINLIIQFPIILTVFIKNTISNQK